MELIVTIAVSLIISLLFTYLSKKLRISSAIGLIIAGILLGSPALKPVFLEPNTEFIILLGNIGFVVLMFLAGLEISLRELCMEKKDAAFIAFFATIIPFAFGFLVFYLLGFPLLVSLVIGISMSITAEATTAKVLLELKKLKTKLGSLIMGAGIIDDIIGLLLFVSVVYFLASSFAARELFLLGFGIAGFFIGIFVHKLIGRERKYVKNFENFLLLFVIPFFFISIGMDFSMSSLAFNMPLLILIIIVAIAGKIIGVFLTKPLTKLNIIQLYLVGWGMNSRGAVELALAMIAFKAGFLNTELYSGIIIMALVTTLIFPFFVRRIIRKNQGVMG